MEDIAAFAAALQFPIVPCDLCGSQPNLRRKRVKALVAELAAEHPAVKGNLLNALGHVVPSHLLDRDLQQKLAAATGKDPWLDADEEEEDVGCGDAEVAAALVKLAGAGEER
jgi:tRNA 2-thiocytidine biosynthesis protein TtcA